MRHRDAFAGEFKRVRPEVLRRDSNRCVKCGGATNLEVHHVYGYKDSSIAHLRTLCYWCHGIAPNDEAYWAWEREGDSGMERAFKCLAAGLQIAPLVLLKAIGSYDECLSYSRMMDAEKLRRSSRESSGRKPYGHYSGEAEVLAEMREIADSGETAAGIARVLNERGKTGRGGKAWHPHVVARILRRADQTPTAAANASRAI